jgi:hypothetical protein
VVDCPCGFTCGEVGAARSADGVDDMVVPSPLLMPLLCLVLLLWLLSDFPVVPVVEELLLSLGLELVAVDPPELV